MLGKEGERTGAWCCVWVAGDAEMGREQVLLQYMSARGFQLFVVFILACLAGLFLLRDNVKRRYVIVYTLICSLTGSLTVMCIKGVSTALILTINVSCPPRHVRAASRARGVTCGGRGEGERQRGGEGERERGGEG